MSKNQIIDPMSKRPDYLPSTKVDIPVEEQVRFPRLKLMQALSPELTTGNEKFVVDPSDPKGKKALLSAGELFLQGDTVHRQIDGEEGIVVIPVAIRKRYVEYVKRDQGGGFVASYDSKEECDANSDPANDIQTTIEFLCLEADVEDPTPFSITFDTITKLGVARKWAGFIGQYQSLNGVKYLVTAKQQVNKQKQAYYNFNVQPVGWVDQKQLTAIEVMTSEVEPLFLPAGSNSEI